MSDTLTLQELVEFVMRHRGPCFKGVSADDLAARLYFHIKDKTLVVARDASGALTGVACGTMFQCNSLASVNAMRRFDWRRSDRSGNAFYVGNTIAANTDALKQMIAQLFEILHGTNATTVYSHRHGRIVKWSGKKFLRVLRMI